MKACTRCSTVKPLDSFHAHAGRPDGRHPWCKDCRSSLGKSQRSARADRAREAEQLGRIGLKRCSRCGESQPVESYYRRADDSTGRKSQCISCYRAAQKDYNASEAAKQRKRRERARRRASDPETFARRSREATFKSKYGITLACYEVMIQEQGGCCAICREPSISESLAVDHCHRTGRIRGLLCRACNAGIGMLGDDARRVESALRYLLATQGLAGADAVPGPSSDSLTEEMS